MHFMQAMTEPENSHGVDVNKTKQDVGKKYANGGAKAINKEKYSA